jgi:hypothetical protein
MQPAIIANEGSRTRRPAGVRRRWAVLLACAVAGSALGLDVRMELDPEVLRVGESARLRVVMEGVDRAAPPNLPPVDGLRFSGPSVEQSFHMTNVNGVREQRRTLTYTYGVMPLRPGDFTVGPFSYTHHGQTVELPARRLRVVVPAGEAGAPSAVSDMSDLVFAEVVVSKDEVYVNEPFTLNLVLYTSRVNLGREISLTGMPDEGLEIQPYQELRATREVIENEVYDVRRYQTQIRPLTAGTIRFEPEMVVQLLVERAARRPPGFDQSLFRGWLSNMEAHPLELRPAPAEVVVRSLPPSGRPEGFGGGVGRFSFEVELDPSTVQVGDPATLILRLEGEGNIDAVGVPELPESDAFRAYPARLVSSDLDRAGYRGRKVYEQVIIPRTEEVTEVPALTFSYFDPAEHGYRSIARGPLALEVQAADPDKGRTVRSGPTEDARTARMVGDDIRYLQPAPAHWTRLAGGRGPERPGFWAWQGLPVAVVLWAWWMGRRRRALSSDVALARRYRAPRAAQAGLRRAEKALSKQDEAAFYEGLWKALVEYFGHRLNWPAGLVTGEAVGRALQQQGLDEEQRQRVEKLFTACEQRRFAGVRSGPEAMRRRLDDFRRVLKACERVKS